MSAAEPESPQDWQIETGRSDGGKTFMRVVHLPTRLARGVESVGDRGAEWRHWLITEIREELRRRTFDADALAGFARLWNGSEHGWCLQEFRRHERRLVVLFEPPGAAARDILALSSSFEEYRDRPPRDLLREIGGKTRFMLGKVYGASDGQTAAQRARENGLRVEEWTRDEMVYLPVNEVTKRAAVISDHVLAAAVAEKMRSCGVKVIPDPRGT